MTSLRLETFTVERLKPLNLVVTNEIVCLSGPSGSGKSLLLRAIADLIVHQGEAYLGDELCSETFPPQWRKRVGYLPAESAWWLDKVGDHFKLRDEYYLQKLNLTTECFNWDIARCSTGEKQRLAIARLLELEPEVLLLDEPTASLDPSSVLAVESLIKEYADEKQVAVIWVSHNPQQIKRVAKRHYEIKDDAIIEVAL